MRTPTIWNINRMYLLSSKQNFKASKVVSVLLNGFYFYGWNWEKRISKAYWNSQILKRSSIFVTFYYLFLSVDVCFVKPFSANHETPWDDDYKTYLSYSFFLLGSFLSICNCYIYEFSLHLSRLLKKFSKLMAFPKINSYIICISLVH